MALKGKERRQLRALGHHLSPVVQVGHSGVTRGVISAVNQALEDHELVKVKVGEGPEDRHDVADALASATGSEVAQILGKTILLFRKRAKKSKFEKLGGPVGPAPAAKGETKGKAGKAKTKARAPLTARDGGLEDEVDLDEEDLEDEGADDSEDQRGEE